MELIIKDEILLDDNEEYSLVEGTFDLHFDEHSHDLELVAVVNLDTNELIDLKPIEQEELMQLAEKYVERHYSDLYKSYIIGQEEARNEWNPDEEYDA